MTSGKFDKALKKEDLRNTIHEAEKLLGVTIAFDGSELAVTHQDLSVVLEKDRNVINNREDSELVIKVKIFYACCILLVCQLITLVLGHLHLTEEAPGLRDQNSQSPFNELEANRRLHEWRIRPDAE